jgi:hypothetical protein
MRLAAVFAIVGVAAPSLVQAQAGESSEPRFVLRGFSNVDFNVPWGDSDPDGEEPNSAFLLGQFDLYMTSRLTDQISFLGEVVFELNEAQEAVVDVERLQIRYRWSDGFRAAAGRGHTALGYWNEVYHHGALLQPTVERPEALKFEDDGGILPVHFVGLEVGGKALAGAWTLRYVGTVANGRGPGLDVIQGTADANDSKAWGAKLGAGVGAARSIEFGPVLYADTIPADPATPGRESELSERILGGYAVYHDARVELFSEYFHVRHTDQSDQTRFDHQAGYAIGVLRAGSWRPYLGIDWLDLEEGDAFFAGHTDLTRLIAGIRYDTGAFHAIKLEYRHDDRPWGVAEELALQAAFTF